MSGDADRTDIVEKIDQARRQWQLSENAGNAGELAALCTDDFVLIPPHQPPNVGVEAAERELAAFFADYDVAMEFSSEVVEVNGDLAVDYGTISGTIKAKDDGETYPIDNTYVLVFRRVDDNVWKQCRHIWNANE